MKQQLFLISYILCILRIQKNHIFYLEKFRALENRDTVVLKTTASTIVVINYLINKKVSRQYENLVTAALKCIYEINEAILNWKKTK
jgi:hypothetical protein